MPQRAWLLLLGLLVLLTGAPRFWNGFVYDDVAVIVEGTLIHDPARLPEAWFEHTMVASASDPGTVQSVDTYRPLPITSFALDAAISGHAPWAFHLSGLLLHLLCSLLVMMLGERWLGPRLRAEAFYGAAVFAVHPWLVEAHGWINGRSDPLALAFGLLAVLGLLEAESRPRRGLRPLAAGLFLLGLLSKETLITLAPAILLLPPPHDARPSDERRVESASSLWSRRGARLWPLLVASGLYLAARSAVLGGVRTHRDAAMLGDALENLPWLLFDGARNLVVPSVPYLRSLRDEYAALPPWAGAAALSTILGAAFLLYRYRRRLPLAAAGFTWMLLPLVPVAVISTLLWPGFGRYLYLPAAGFAWALAEGAARLRGRVRPALLASLAAAHLLVLSVLTVGFLRDFRNDETLYRAAAEHAPDIAMPHGWLGMARVDSQPAQAVEPLLRAVSLDPDTARYRLHLSRALLASGDRERAYQQALEGAARHRTEPAAAGFHLAAVNALPRRDPDLAVAHLVACLQARPGRPDCLAFLSELLEDHPDGAHCRSALRHAPVGPLRDSVIRRCGSPR